MFMTKLKITTGLVLLPMGLLTSGTGVYTLASGEREFSDAASETDARGFVAPNEPDSPKLDQYGDPLPDGAIARLGFKKCGATGDPVAFSPDGKTLVSLSSGSIQLWETATGTQIQRLLGSQGRFGL